MVLSVRGKNGSGKSSLLAILAGVLPPSEGELLFAEQNVYQAKEAYGVHVNYVPHTLGLWPELTVRENLWFWAKMKLTEECVDAAIEYWQLENLLHTPVRMLSAGWQKRIALARAMACPAEIWLLDEPFAHLDAHGQSLLLNLMQIRAMREGIIIFSQAESESELQGVPTLQIEDFACPSS